MAEYMQTHGLSADILLPIPLHPQRRSERGFNQSELIADALGAYCELPIMPGIIQRVKHTQPQTELSAKERRENVKDAFAVSGEIAGQNVLLIDDVFTTGSTMAECAKTLEEAGAHCTCFTAARAVDSAGKARE